MSNLTPAEITQIVRDAVRAELVDLKLSTRADDAYLTIQDVCDRLNISKTTLWGLRRKGKITGHPVGRRVLFRDSDVDALVGGDK